MKIVGSAELHASRADVWRALNDPAVLVRTIPGCLRLEETGDDSYAMTVTAGVGSIKGIYAGQVLLRDQREPASFLLRATGSGVPGTMSADVRVTLHEDDGATRLEYAADATVGGMIGGVGQRMLTGVASRTAGEFFAAVDGVLAGERPAGAAEGGTAAPAGVPGPTTARERAVYEAPTSPSVPRSFWTREFNRGLLAGAAVALAGVIVGEWIAGRRRADG